MIKKYFLILLVLLASVHRNNGESSSNADKRNDSKLTIVVLLHLYNLNLMDEFIERVNNLIARNTSFNFYLKVNIPISSNMDSFLGAANTENISLEEQQSVLEYCLALTPYHPEIITEKNILKCFALEHYLREKLSLSRDKVQVMFSENRGVDVGGFFLMLDQLINQKLSHDYIIKLHSKTHEKWRDRLLTMLDLDLKNYLPKYDAMYGCQKACSDKDVQERKVKRLMRPILNQFHLKQKKEFFFCGGTMFIVSSKFTDFFKQYNRLDIFQKLQCGYEKRHLATEHIYERFFGYLMEHLQCNVHYCNQHINSHLM